MPVIGLSLGFCRKWFCSAEFKATGKVFTIFIQQQYISPFMLYHVLFMQCFHHSMLLLGKFKTTWLPELDLWHLCFCMRNHVYRCCIQDLLGVLTHLCLCVNCISNCEKGVNYRRLLCLDFLLNCRLFWSCTKVLVMYCTSVSFS